MVSKASAGLQLCFRTAARDDTYTAAQ